MPARRPGAWRCDASGRSLTLKGLDNLASVGGEIYLANVEDITALSGLNEITSLRAARVASFDGLQNITHITGNLNVENYGGQGLALDSLVAIEGVFEVQGSTLGGMAGTGALEHVGGTLSLRSSDVDTSAGFGSLEAVGALSVYQYDRAAGDADLSGLSGLTYVGGLLSLQLKDDQTTVTGLSNVETIEGTLDLRSAEAIADFDDFGSLTAIGGDIITPRDMDPDVVDAFVLSLDHFTGDVR